MSNSDPRHRLTVTIPEPGLEILVLDADGAVMARSTGDENHIAADLPRGLYLVRATRGGLFHDMPVRHLGEQTVEAESPPRFSAATIPGAWTTHEYYTYPAWEASWQHTSPEIPWNGPAEAGLMLFVRAPNVERYHGEDFLDSLALRTERGDILTTFTDDAARNMSDGWAAWSANLSPGLLILESQGDDARQVPIPLMPGWQTQLFVMHRRRLLWEDLRVATVSLDEIATRRNRGPYDIDADDIAVLTDMDAGLAALQNDVHTAAERLVHRFLNAKFRNPILGLLGAYLMLLRARASAEPNTRLMRVVLDNLAHLAPDSADLQALKLLAAPWIDPPPPQPVHGIPLFRAGAEALIDAAASNPELLPEGSMLDVISEHLLGDTVWTTWRAVPLPPSVTTVAFGLAPAAGTDAPDWLELAVADAVTAAGQRDIEPSVAQIVRQVGVSPHAFRKAFDRLVARAVDQPMSLESTGMNLHALGSTLARRVADSVGATTADLVPRITTALERMDQPAPGIQQIYARLKRSIAEVARTDVGNVSADTPLSTFIDRDDSQASHAVRRRLERGFREANLHLKQADIDSATTVRDLARRIESRLRR